MNMFEMEYKIQQCQTMEANNVPKNVSFHKNNDA